MFKKNDPLIDPIKKIMQENEIRRQVEMSLCEELGIQSRAALPYDHYANYDALLAEKIAQTLSEAESSKNMQLFDPIGTGRTDHNSTDYYGNKARLTRDADDYADGQAISDTKRKARTLNTLQSRADHYDALKKLDPEEAETYKKHLPKMYGAPNPGTSDSSKRQMDGESPTPDEYKKREQKLDNDAVNSAARRNYEIKQANSRNTGNAAEAEHRAKIRDMSPEFTGADKAPSRSRSSSGSTPKNESLKEALRGKQGEIDANNNGDVDAHDFKLLRKGVRPVAEEGQINELTGKGKLGAIYRDATQKRRQAADVDGDMETSKKYSKTAHRAIDMIGHNAALDAVRSVLKVKVKSPYKGSKYKKMDEDSHEIEFADKPGQKFKAAGKDPGVGSGPEVKDKDHSHEIEFDDKPGQKFKSIGKAPVSEPIHEPGKGPSAPKAAASSDNKNIGSDGKPYQTPVYPSKDVEDNDTVGGVGAARARRADATKMSQKSFDKEYGDKPRNANIIARADGAARAKIKLKEEQLDELKQSTYKAAEKEASRRKKNADDAIAGGHNSETLKKFSKKYDNIINLARKRQASKIEEDNKVSTDPDHAAPAPGPEVKDAIKARVPTDAPLPPPRPKNLKEAKASKKILDAYKSKKGKGMSFDDVMEEIAKNLGKAKMKQIEEDEEGAGDATSTPPPAKKPVAPSNTSGSTPGGASGGSSPSDATSTPAAAPAPAAPAPSVSSALGSGPAKFGIGGVNSASKPAPPVASATAPAAPKATVQSALGSGPGKFGISGAVSAIKPVSNAPAAAPKTTVQSALGSGDGKFGLSGPQSAVRPTMSSSSSSSDRPAAGARNAAGNRPAAPRPAAAAAPAQTKSAQMFQSSNDEGGGGSAASFFAADRQAQAERSAAARPAAPARPVPGAARPAVRPAAGGRMMRESLENTIRNILKD